MFNFACIASGSSGNCTYIENSKKKILVDAGVSGKRIKENLSSINRDIDEINAIIVSHDHIDHIRGIGVLSRRHHIPVYITKKTYEQCSLALGKLHEINYFDPGQTIGLDGLKIETFSTPHDASDPVNFIINNKEKSLGLITDVGTYQGIKDRISNIDAAIIESNHDLELLKTCHYPYFLKQRIASEVGHLSNPDSRDFILKHADHTKLKNIVLAHLSENSNNPEIAFKTMEKGLKKNKLKTSLTVAPRHDPSELFKI